MKQKLLLFLLSSGIIFLSLASAASAFTLNDLFLGASYAGVQASTMPSSISTCVDSDGGLNYGTFGIVTSISSSGNRTYSDYCYTSSTLAERYCRKIWTISYVSSFAYNCNREGKVCKAGECTTDISIECIPSAEICDAKDNDCDGQTDEDFPNKGRSCSAGVGACLKSGTYICSSDKLSTACSAAAGQPSTEACDGIDNDCDGLKDEDFSNLGRSCSAGEGACLRNGTYICSSDKLTTACSTTAGQPSAETCDAKDNDCDGQIDEGFNVSQACSAGAGECLRTGTYVCKADGTGTECTAVPGAPTTEVCDGKDNDCDGAIDEGCVCTNGQTQLCPLQSGVCSGSFQTCASNQWPGCTAANYGPNYQATETRCDAQDNDCDGLKDEDFSNLGSPCSAGVGACLRSGTYICSSDNLSTTCSAAAGQPSAEICDGIDNDCDGQTDEDFPNKGRSCSAGVGACLRSGTYVCSSDKLSTICGATPGQPSAEICDAKDNDCDGLKDEDFPNKGSPCSSGVGACLRSGTYVCSSDKLSTACGATPGQPSAEACDGIDNDCDGAIDENSACTTDYYCDSDSDSYIGQDIDGTCFELNCVPSGCSATIGNDCNDTNAAISPGNNENCNIDGKDNDCDGMIDECDTCRDGIKNGNESDVDCGGNCKFCELNKICRTSNDCLSSYCESGTCKAPSYALNPDCKPIKFDNTSLSSHINIVLVPSGFNGSMELFRQKAEWVFSKFASYEPFNQTIQQYNVFYVPVEKGDYCHFNCNGIARLLCCTTSTAKQLSSKCTTGPRQTIVIENSGTYGGAGYRSEDVGTTSINSAAPKVAVHELGHSLFNLGDEYTYEGSSSTAGNSPNCDYSGCAKWSDMLGYNGVKCNSNRCKGGSYYASESSIMLSLSYKFEEVNLRLSCCIYYKETGVFPPYCDQFKQFTSSGNLNDFCRVTPPQGAAPAASPIRGTYLEKPYEYQFVKDDKGNWTIASITPKRSGVYQAEEIYGEGAGNLRILVKKDSITLKELRFDPSALVEYPISTENMGGYVKIPRNSLSIIVNQKDTRPSNFTINGKIINMTLTYPTKILPNITYPTKTLSNITYPGK